MQYARDCTWGRRRYEYLWFRSMSLIFPYYKMQYAHGVDGVMNICGWEACVWYFHITGDQTQIYALIYFILIINHKKLFMIYQLI